jgi:hypothetical protein
MKKNDSSAKNIRIFLLLLAAFAALLLWRGFGRVDGALKLKIGAAIAVLALFFAVLPRLFAPAYRAIMTVTGFIGNAVFMVVATVVFFVLLTPIALVMRLFGKQFMAPRCEPRADSYFECPQAAHGFDKQY